MCRKEWKDGDIGRVVGEYEQRRVEFPLNGAALNLKSGNPTQSNPNLVPFIHLWRTGESMAIQERMISTRRVMLRLEYSIFNK